MVVSGRLYSRAKLAITLTSSPEGTVTVHWVAFVGVQFADQFEKVEFVPGDSVKVT